MVNDEFEGDLNIFYLFFNINCSLTKRLHNSSFLDIHYILLIHWLLVMYWNSLDSFGVQQTFDLWALSDCPSWHAHGGESLNMDELPYWGMSTKSKFTYTATHHSLQVHLRVPITVIQNHNICRGQVDPHTTCPSAQHENKLFTSRHVIYALIADCLSSCGVCPSRRQYSNPFHRQ